MEEMQSASLCSKFKFCHNHVFVSYLPQTPREEVWGSLVVCGPPAEKQEARSAHRRK